MISTSALVAAPGPAILGCAPHIYCESTRGSRRDYRTKVPHPGVLEHTTAWQWYSACTRPCVPTRIDDSTEVFQREERLPAVDPWVEKLVWLMDGAIPIGRWSVGLDGFLGLIPGFGDVVGALISMLIVMRAVQSGIPRVAVARMVTNIAADTLIGSIPLFGDAFDFAYKANVKNLRIYQEALVDDSRATTVRHWGFFILALLAIAAVVVGTVSLVMVFARFIAGGIMK
jgi:hypothetical protein